MKLRLLAAALAATVVLPFSAASAADLEVTHWWTSGGEAAAVSIKKRSTSELYRYRFLTNEVRLGDGCPYVINRI